MIALTGERGETVEHSITQEPQISILCAEDDPVTRNLLSIMIAKKFPEVQLYQAENGQAGLELYKARKPDIVITDLRMPLLDGIQMAGEIKSLDPETVIIVVSAHNDAQYLLKAIEIGINHYVMKPVDHHQLISVIEKSIAGIRLHWRVKVQEEEIEQLASFTQMGPDPVLETDLSGKIIYHNDAAEKIVRELDPDVGLGLFLPADLQEMLGMFRGKKAIQFSREVAIKGRSFAENIYFAQRFETVRIYARDITERKKMEEDILRVQKLESLGVLAGGIAHCFNNILTAILGNLSLARMQSGPSSSIARRMEECEKASIQASELIQQLLTFSSGGAPVKKTIAFSPLLKGAVSFVLRGTNVKGNVEIPDDLWCVEADGAQLSQALQNLLINATQAVPEGGDVIVRAENETLGHDNPHRLPPGDYLMVCIEDHGCGIPREHLDKIFDPYFTTKPHGTGLGLSAVYSIIKKHGGAIEVSSVVGKGSSFFVRIPALPLGQPEDGTASKSEPAGNGRILLMDDEECIREIATEILEYVGYQVESCADGKEAVERFTLAKEGDAPFAAVILDLTVPGGMGGKDAAQLLRSADPNVVLIVSSGYSNDPVMANYRQYGFSAAIIKPFDAGTLARELGRLVPLDN